jgi:CheY-like chemotaxis protein
LTLVKRLVELHGGQVEARSDGAGKGSALVVRLPRIAAAPVISEAKLADAAPEAGCRCRILVIEDNADVRESLRDLLESSRHEVYEAADGSAGVDAALALCPEVALIDIGLPALNGYEVARRLRADDGCADTVLIALTGYAQDADRQRAIEAGFHGYLAKPVDPKQLMELIVTLSSRASGSSTAGQPTVTAQVNLKPQTYR